MRRGFLPRRLPHFLVTVGLRFPRTIVAASLIAWLLAGFVAFHIDVVTDILSLVPRHNRVVSQFKTTLERFGSVDLLLAVVHLKPHEDLSAELAYADMLAAQLRSWKSIGWVEYRLEDPSTTAAPLLDHATLFLGPDKVRHLLGELNPQGLQKRAGWLRAELTAPQGLVAQDLLREDPLGMLQGVLKQARLGDLGARFDPATGYLIDPHRTCLLMLAKPVRPAQDVLFDRMLVRSLKYRVEAANRAWREAGWEGDPPRVEFTGGYVIAMDDAQLIKGDMTLGMVTSLIGVLLLFLLAFRRPAALVFAFFPLVTGLALTLIFVGIALHTLNSVTSAFAALLIGLGIDFVIVLYGRYMEEIRHGATHEGAVEAMGRNTGVGVLLGAVTTAATFYAFLITDFKGLSSLGLLTGTGILLLVLTVFLLLPALLTMIRPGRRKGVLPHLHSFGSDFLCRLSFRKPRLALILVLLVTVILGIAAFSLRFDDDIRNMRAAGNPGVLLRHEIMEKFGLRFTPMMIRVDGRTEQQALARARRVLKDVRPLIDGKNLAGIDTIADLLPPVSSQREVIAELEAAHLDPGRLRAEIGKALAGAGLNPAAFQAGIDHVMASLAVRRPISTRDVAGTPLARVVERYVATFPGGVSTLIYCYAPPGRWRREPPPALEKAVARHPHAVLSGINVISRELREIVWGDAARASVLGFVVVFILLMLDLGGIRQSVLALLPLVVGSIWMLGGMALFGLTINVMNVFVLTMIIGIGVDYGVHLLHRWNESGGDEMAVTETSRAIAVAALTTVVGFGSLVLSHFPGLRSVGAVAILGALATAVVSMTLLPALLERLRHRG